MGDGWAHLEAPLSYASMIAGPNAGWAGRGEGDKRMPVEMSPAEVALQRLLYTHFDAIGADMRRCDEDVVSEDYRLVAYCHHPENPDVGTPVLLEERIDWRLPQAGIVVNFGQVQAGRCQDCGTILYTLI